MPRRGSAGAPFIAPADGSVLRAGPPRPAIRIGGVRPRPGRRTRVQLAISEFYTSSPSWIPVVVVRGRRDGPRVFVTGALHGNEVNGIEVVRRLAARLDPARLAGTLICVPVVNIFGLALHSRLLPDHRDLDHHFPGSRTGSTAARMAHLLYREVIGQCDYGIDLHTDPDGLTYVPHCLCDLRDGAVAHLVRAFGAPLALDLPPPEGTLRCAAAQDGIPTLIFRGGEFGRFDARVAEFGFQGICRVLVHLGMWRARLVPAAPVMVARHPQWVRPAHGGLLHLRAHLGERVRPGKVLGYVLEPFGRVVERLYAPASGIVVALATGPLVQPGSPAVSVAAVTRSR